ncbi:hypothetical protein KORDIASMS9_00345 [Kordia sp. SMS9]|uniref:hypothetical protein n=1 Tax=Kordia sp. SMS9 TaxID=2282170 RepID=UPI000E0CDC69|nr:hypothetical protein [Kordia sp. SMS9]AXG68155.1 hypothetical protein KORDIASMS9_00345 [Kordia sp. SMS9]
MKNLNVNQQKQAQTLSMAKSTVIVLITMMMTIFCTNSVTAQTWSNLGDGEYLDRWTINDDNSDHWSQLRLQVGTTQAWNILSEGSLKWSYDTSANHSNLGYRKMSLTTDGKLGIGDFDPVIHLAIGDSDTGFNQNGDGELGIYTNNIERIRIDNYGFVGIGTVEPTEKLQVYGNIRLQGNLDIEHNKSIKSEGIMHIQADDDNTGDGIIHFKAGPDTRMTLADSGKLGIGTTNMPNTVGGADVSAYKLYVQGGVLTEEVRVRTGWADYVFADDYQLLSIKEVENFIKENKHLPNVPSAKTVEEEGLELGDITRIQQEKIEELMLYIIEQQKQIDALKLSIDGLIRRNKNSTKN